MRFPGLMRVVAFTTAIVWGMPSFAQGTECHAPVTQTDMNLCSYQEFQDADMALDRLYQQQMAALTMPTRVQLKAAQRAWVQFRDASCLYEVGSRAASGTIWPLLQNTCLTGLTRKRIEEMEAYIACDREGCPR